MNQYNIDDSLDQNESILNNQSVQISTQPAEDDSDNEQSLNTSISFIMNPITNLPNIEIPLDQPFKGEVIQRYYRQEFQNILEPYNVTLSLKNENLQIIGGSNANFEQVRSEIYNFMNSVQSQELSLDAGSVRAFYSNNLVRDELKSRQIYCHKQKVGMDQFTVRLVSRVAPLQEIKNRINEDFRGLRLFFINMRDQSNFEIYRRPKQAHLGVNTCMAQLIAKYYKKFMSLKEIEKHKFIMSADVIDQENSNISLTVACNMSGLLRANKQDCQNRLRQWISLKLMSKFYFIIQFDKLNETTTQQIRKLEQFINDTKHEGEFLATSILNLQEMFIMIIGDEQALLTLFIQYLLPILKDAGAANELQLDGEFVGTFKIIVHKLNYLYNGGVQQIGINLKSVESDLSSQSIQFTQDKYLFTIQMKTKRFSNYVKIIGMLISKKKEMTYDNNKKRIDDAWNILQAYSSQVDLKPLFPKTEQGQPTQFRRQQEPRQIQQIQNSQPQSQPQLQQPQLQQPQQHPQTQIQQQEPPIQQNQQDISFIYQSQLQLNQSTVIPTHFQQIISKAINVDGSTIPLLKNRKNLLAWNCEVSKEYMQYYTQQVGSLVFNSSSTYLYLIMQNFEQINGISRFESSFEYYTDLAITISNMNKDNQILILAANPEAVYIQPVLEQTEGTKSIQTANQVYPLYIVGLK